MEVGGQGRIFFNNEITKALKKPLFVSLALLDTILKSQ
jgi:hypothetical protein